MTRSHFVIRLSVIVLDWIFVIVDAYDFTV